MVGVSGPVGGSHSVRQSARLKAQSHKSRLHGLEGLCVNPVHDAHAPKEECIRTV